MIHLKETDAILKGWCGHCCKLTFGQDEKHSFGQTEDGLTNTCPKSKGKFVVGCKDWEPREEIAPILEKMKLQKVKKTIGG